MKSGCSNPWFIAGIVLIVVSLIGLASAIAALASAHNAPQKGIAFLRDEHARRLAATGVPAEAVAAFREGASLTDSQRAGLSKQHLQSIESAEEFVRQMAAGFATGAKVAAQKARFGLGASSVVLLIGIVMAAKGRHKKRSASAKGLQSAA